MYIYFHKKILIKKIYIFKVITLVTLDALENGLTMRLKQSRIREKLPLTTLDGKMIYP